MTNLPLTQDVTYWSTTGTDGNGDPSFAAGVAVKCRYAEIDGLFTDERGDDHKVKWAIYSVTAIPKRALVVLGDFNGVATPPTGARKIFTNYNNPSISNLKKHVA